MSDSKLYALRPDVKVVKSEFVALSRNPTGKRFAPMGSRIALTKFQYENLFTEFDVEQLQQQVEKILGDYVEFIQGVQEQWDDGKPIKFGDNFKKFDATVAAVVGLLKGETE